MTTGERSTLIVVDSSAVTLRGSKLDLCAERLPEFRFGDSVVNRYAFEVNNGGRLVMAWNQNPFKRSCFAAGDSSSDDSVKNVRTFAVQFYPQNLSTESTDLCPTGYVKAADGICYGSLGYFYYYPYNHPNLLAYLGVLFSETKLNLLPVAPRVGSVKPLATVQAGATIEISGRWFMNDVKVTVDGAPCDVTRVGIAGNVIECTLPAVSGTSGTSGTARARQIIVRNPSTEMVSNSDITVSY